MQAKGLKVWYLNYFLEKQPQQNNSKNEDIDLFPPPSMFSSSSQIPSLPHIFPPLLNHPTLRFLPCSPPATPLFCFFLLCGSQLFPFPFLNTTLQAHCPTPLSPQLTLCDWFAYERTKPPVFYWGNQLVLRRRGRGDPKCQSRGKGIAELPSGS